MDGEFCSIMPKGNNKNNFLLYHVGKSVIYETERFNAPLLFVVIKFLTKNRFIKKFIYDKIINFKIKKIFSESKKYYTFLDYEKCIGYWQSVRALPINDNDSRLSLIRTDDFEDKKIISVLSGKITTCWYIADKINKSLDENIFNR